MGKDEAFNQLDLLYIESYIMLSEHICLQVLYIGFMIMHRGVMQLAILSQILNSIPSSLI